MQRDNRASTGSLLVGPSRPSGGGPEFDITGAVWTLIRTDFLVRYHGTAMGFLWALLKPLAMLAVLLFVFSVAFAGTPDYAVRLAIGLLLWEYFQDATKVGLVALHTRGYLINRCRFPRWIFVVTSTANALVTVLVASVGVVAYLALRGRAPSLGALALYAFYLACYFTIVTGFSLATSVLFVRYRDLNQVWEVVTNAGFFIAPIIYPLSIVPERLHLLLYVWPPTPVIEFSRAVLTGETAPTRLGHVALVALAATCFTLGVAVYRRLAPAAAEFL